MRLCHVSKKKNMPFRLPKKKKKNCEKKKRKKIGVFKGAYSVYIISLVNVNELFFGKF